MKVIAIDPGNVESAWLMLDNGKISGFGKLANMDMRRQLPHQVADHLAIEMVASYGMAVGASVFETALWTGRFIERWLENELPFSLVYRKDVKMHLCNSMRAKDGNIRQALIDRFGAPGTKKNPGGTYGISKDVWSALAIAVTFADKHSV